MRMRVAVRISLIRFLQKLPTFVLTNLHFQMRTFFCVLTQSRSTTPPHQCLHFPLVQRATMKPVFER